jgi:hypothetical protein
MEADGSSSLLVINQGSLEIRLDLLAKISLPFVKSVYLYGVLGS